MELAVAFMLALMAPFLLWPVEQVIHQPVVVEEIYKAVLVWLILRARPQNRLFWVLLVGLAFSVSETMLYLLPVVMNGEWGSWGVRWITTIPMHVITMLIQFWGWAVGVGPLGIIPAILGHGWFNQVVR